MALTQDIIRGSVDSGARSATQHPQEWRKDLFEQIPVGGAKLTALLRRMGKEVAKSKIVNWQELAFASQRGDVTDVYTDAALSAAYASGGVVGTPLYINMAEADANQIVSGDTIMIMDSDGYMRNVHVRAVTINGASSYVYGELQQTDTSNKLAGATLTWTIVGNSHPESSELPTALYEEGEWFTNYCEIFMEACEMSGTEIAELDRTSPNIWGRAIKRAKMRLDMKIERAMLFGVARNGTYAGKPQLHMGGLVPAITTNESGNIFNYKTDASYSGKTWLAGGMNWLEDLMEVTSRYSAAPTKLFLCGSLAALAIQRAVLDAGDYQLTPMTNRYGIRVKRLDGLSTSMDVLSHPLFTENPALRSCGVLVEPAMLHYLHMRGRDVQFVKPGTKDVAGNTWVDGKKAGWFGQISLRYDNLAAMGFLSNLGETNTA